MSYVSRKAKKKAPELSGIGPDLGGNSVTQVEAAMRWEQPATAAFSIDSSQPKEGGDQESQSNSDSSTAIDNDIGSSSDKNNSESSNSSFDSTKERDDRGSPSNRDSSTAIDNDIGSSSDKNNSESSNSISRLSPGFDPTKEAGDLETQSNPDSSTVMDNDLRTNEMKASDKLSSSNNLKYIVKPGDTLSKISEKFYEDPSLYSEIWSENPQITNPHWIYSGEQLSIPNSASKVDITQGSEINTTSESTSKTQIASEWLSEELSTGSMRREAIAGNLPGRITLSENPKAMPNPDPWYSLESHEQVTENDSLITKAANRNGVDPDLFRAIIWLETTHGWYDKVTGIIKPPKTIRPSNIHVEYWSSLGVSRESLKDPEINLEVGAYILNQITRRIDNPTPERIATLYNNLRADKVSDYGKTVGYYYRTKPWKHSHNK